MFTPVLPIKTRVIGREESSAMAADWDLLDHVYGTLYGQCVGDTIGLLTEFMNKAQTKKTYGAKKDLEFSDKIEDLHRKRWKVGDWTDDSDQMIAILISLISNAGETNVQDIAQRLWYWKKRGYPELGDHVGMGIGTLTDKVMEHKKFKTEPFVASEEGWKELGSASNGSAMRTSILGIHRYQDIEKVVENAATVSKITHFDPRCVASCVAVSCAIAFMLQRSPRHLLPTGQYNIDTIIQDSYARAKPFLRGKNYRKNKKEMKQHMLATTLKELQLDDKNGIGYVYKCMGSGFWALKQNDFRTALQDLIMEGGDADTNGAVAGAMLGCKLGSKLLPNSWRDQLLHKDWADEKLTKFLETEELIQRAI